MSRIGKLPIQIPAGVTISQKDNVVTVKGPKGELSQYVDPSIKMNVEDTQIIFEIDENSPVNYKQKQAFHGLYRSLVNNMVVGVSQGYSKTMELVVQDVTLLEEDLRDFLLQVRRRNLNNTVMSHDCVSESCQIICYWICHKYKCLINRDSPDNIKKCVITNLPSLRPESNLQKPSHGTGYVKDRIGECIL